MATAPDSQPPDLPPLPPPHQDDLSPMRANQIPSPGFVVGNDAEALRKIGNRTSRFGRIFTILIVLGGGTLAFFAYKSAKSADEARQTLLQVGNIENRGEMLAKLRELLPATRDEETKQRILMNLGHFKDAQSVPLLIECLDEAGPIRRSAAWALARIGLPAANPARDKLLQVLPETDERDRAAVVWALAVLREQRAAEAILESFTTGHLQAQDDFDAKVITDVLGTQRLASDPLLMHNKESVRVLVAHALAEANSREAVDPLVRLLQAEIARPDGQRSQEVVRAVAAALGRSGDSRAARPLFDLLRQQPSMRGPVLEALRRSTGAPGLATLIREATDPAIRHDLVQLLADTHDPRSADMLAALLTSEDADIRSTAALALAELGDRRAAPVLLELGRSEDEAVSDDAIDALRDVSSPEIVGGLLELMDARPDRKAPILRALGTSGDPNAARRLESELAGDDVRAAALALADLGSETAYRKLLDMVARPPGVSMSAETAADRKISNEELLTRRRAAILAMARYARPDALPRLMTVVEDPQDDYELRSEAASAIGVVASPEQFQDVMVKIMNPNINATARRYYVQGLWQQPRPSFTRNLLGLISDPNAGPDVRRAAALALGYTADPTADAQLAELLDSAEVRPYAAFAVALGGGEAPAQKLVRLLGEDNDLREMLQDYFLNTENDWFNLITQSAFDGGQIWRRLRAAEILREGDGSDSYGYAYNKAIAVLRSGWDSARGASSPWIREKLAQALNGRDPERQRLAAEALAAMPERGILLRARDEGGPGAEAARIALRESERPGS